ncbi:glycosyltransferase family 2 protein [Microbacterium sp. NPDC086615]|uniref:glycosyltransferase family 2 protein n=1 Tax=Microbacterium sp. NPDC086615 TaxID=3154865 RepID=UPI0034337FAD
MFLQLIEGAELETKISVITVTYNDLRGLQRTRESVQAQSYLGAEHIIIDGASSDGSPAYLQSIASQASVTVRSEPDKGIFDAMNKGLAIADGDLIVFMNAGDTFRAPDTLSIVAESYATHRWGWAYGSVQYVDADGRGKGIIHRQRHRQRLLELGLTFVPHQTMYVSRALVDRLGRFDETLSMAADQDYAIRAGRMSNPTVIPEVLCNFEIGGAHGSLGRIQREMIFHRIRLRNGLLVMRSRNIDRIFAFANGARWFARDSVVRMIRGVRPDR